MREAKQNAISRASEETLVVTMDVQSALICREFISVQTLLYSETPVT